MRRRFVSLQAAIIVSLVFLATLAFSQAPDLEQHLRQEYQGKTFLLRGFYSGDELRYNSTGELPQNTSSGDWTEDGFVTINEVHVLDDRIQIEACRLLVIMRDHEFHFRPAERKELVEPKSQPLVVSIEIYMAMHNPDPELVDAALSRIFLTGQDRLGALVPEYWRSCVSPGLAGKNQNCQFSSEISVVPGVAPAGPASNAIPQVSTPSTDSSGARLNSGVPSHGVFHVGGGVKPPRVLNSPEPEFSESARAVKFQGVMTLAMIVDQEGHPRDIRILSPLGGGLDVKAVHAVENWRFQPAEKDGQPVRVEIAVEVNFHLY